MNIKRRPNRLKSYDYNQQGYYYLTICTKNRMDFFGEISNGIMHPSKMGLIADEYWNAITIYFNSIELDEYIIMPDHIHGIIKIIDKYDIDVGNADLRSSQRNSNSQKLDSNRTKMLVSKIIHGFKSSVTREIHRQFDNTIFGWQKSFYDNIIRNEKELRRIREYIIKNPSKWEKK